MTWRLSYNHLPIVQGYQNNKTRDTHYKRHNIQFWTTLKTKNWITLTSIKTRGEIRCPIANTMVKHTKKAKQNIMHMIVNFWGLFFRTDKIFFGVTRSSCLSVRMTDKFSASFGKSDFGKKVGLAFWHYNVIRIWAMSGPFSRFLVIFYPLSPRTPF